MFPTSSFFLILQKKKGKKYKKCFTEESFLEGGAVNKYHFHTSWSESSAQVTGHQPWLVSDPIWGLGVYNLGQLGVFFTWTESTVCGEAVDALLGPLFIQAALHGPLWAATVGPNRPSSQLQKNSMFKCSCFNYWSLNVFSFMAFGQTFANAAYHHWHI